MKASVVTLRLFLTNQSKLTRSVVDSLRTQVARELDFHGDYINLCDKVRDKKGELAILVSQVDEYQSKLANAKANWDKLFDLIGTEALTPLMSFFSHQDLVQNVSAVEADERMISTELNCDTGECCDEDCDEDCDEGSSQNF